MRVIAFMNQKGGVGKTTTAASVGAALAELGSKVCLIDVDPQAHLTINFGVEPAEGDANLYDVLTEQASFLEAIHQIHDRLAIVPGSIDLAGAEIELVSVIGREQILKQRIESAQHDFDFILLDCPPSLGLLTINALAVATEVIVPMQAHFLALQGMGKLLETIALVNRRMNPALKVAGIVLTMFDSQTKLSAEVVNDISAFLSDARGKPLPWANAVIYRTKIRRNIKLAECPSFGQTILGYDAMSNGAADYRALAREIAAIKAAPASALPAASLAAAPNAVATERASAADAPPPPSPQPSPGAAGEGAESASTQTTHAVATPPAPSATPAATPAAAPCASPAPPAPRAPAVAVTVNSAIDPAKLAAAKAAPPKPRLIPRATLVPKGAVIPPEAIIPRRQNQPVGLADPTG